MVDFKLLARQKAQLIEVLAFAMLTPQQHNDLSGLVNFIDSFQDENPDSVYLHEDGYYNQANEKVGEYDLDEAPNWPKLIRDVVDSEDDIGCDGLTVIDKEAFDRMNTAWLGAHHD